MTERRLRESGLVPTILQANGFMDVWFPMLVEGLAPGGLEPSFEAHDSRDECGRVGNHRHLRGCSTLALLLASLGIYGVVAYSVRQQTREIAIRVAVGARPREVISVAVSRTAMWAAAGLLAGLAVAMAVSRMLAHTIDFIVGAM